LGPETGYFNQEISRNSVVHLKEKADIKIKQEICTYLNMLVTLWPPINPSFMVSAIVQRVFNHFIKENNFKIPVQKISVIRCPLTDPLFK